MSEALRMALSEGLSDALDKQIVNGTNGLLEGTNLANHNVSCGHHVCALPLPIRLRAR